VNYGTACAIVTDALSWQEPKDSWVASQLELAALDPSSARFAELTSEGFT
jgi:hypothetical protein